MMAFLNRFSVKLSALFLVLLVAMGIAQVLITMRISERRQVEVDQLVNWNLARDMVTEIEPFLAPGDSLESVGSIIHYMMVLNPSIEIYVLDGRGEILAFFAEPGKDLSEDRVNLEPVRLFLSGDGDVPLFGEDPRHPGRQKHFSAAPLSLPDGSGGYLYIVLQSALYDTTGTGLRERYTVSALVRALLLSILCVGVVGIVMFALLATRLQRVVRTVKEFEGGNYEQRVKAKSTDEIGELGRAFNRMADTIAANLQKLKDTDSLRRELIANVSHDLRSPLTSIQGYVETLLMKLDDLSRDELNGYLQTILNDSSRLNDMVHELFGCRSWKRGRSSRTWNDFRLPS